MTFASGGNKYYYIIGTGQPGLEENAAPDEENPPKATGSQHNIIMQKNGSRYNIVAWQERYI
jgi:hypothetical protein